MLTAVLVTSAAALIESVPFILAAAALAHVPLRWSARLVPYLGCGCGGGPSARSIPAAAATWIVFGPIVAVLRVCAAGLIACVVRRRSACEHEAPDVLAQLRAIAPLAAIGAACTPFATAIFPMHSGRLAEFAGGALAAFAIAPCGFGAVALASSLRGTMPTACAGFLCIAGIVDLRSWLREKHPTANHDALAYILAALACVLIAARHGGGLVHPRLALLLWPCVLACAILAYHYRSHSCGTARIAPAMMLAGAILSSPPPAYHATETTLSEAFAGERIDFTGQLTRTGNAATLVRYAITCCRADAAPTVIRLERNPQAALHGWVHARGVLVSNEDTLRLRVSSLQSIAPPADPFVYR